MPLAKMWANSVRASNSKLPPPAISKMIISMIFNGLNCNAAQYIVPGTFGVREFIFDVNLMI